MVADTKYNHRNSLVYQKLHSCPVSVAPRESRDLRVLFVKINAGLKYLPDDTHAGKDG